MTVLLYEESAGEFLLEVSFWHWRAIVEVVRRLDLLPEERVDGLHRQFEGTGLNATEARAVAVAIRQQVLPMLRPDERILLNGERTTEPDDFTFYHEPETEKNYSTNLEMLEEFASVCERTLGFTVQ